MRYLVMVLLLSCLPACNTLRHLTGSSTNSSQIQALPTVYTLTGTTAIDYQIIQPVRCKDSSIRVWVEIPSSTEFRELNQYEFAIDTQGVGGGGITFQRKADIVVDDKGNIISVLLYSTPAAPKGSQYKIESKLL